MRSTHFRVSSTEEVHLWWIVKSLCSHQEVQHNDPGSAFRAYFSYNIYNAKISHVSFQPQLFHLVNVSEYSIWLLGLSQREKKKTFPEGQNSFPLLFCFYVTQQWLCFQTVHKQNTNTGGMPPKCLWRRPRAHCHCKAGLTAALPLQREAWRWE